MVHRSGKVDVVIAGTVITFDEPLASVDYSVAYRCYDPITLEDIPATVNPALYTTDGFTVVPLADASFEYQVTEQGGGTSDPDVIVAGRVTVTAGTNQIVFPYGLSTTAYAMSFRCFNPVTFEEIGCDVDPAYFTTAGFRAVAIDGGTLEYQATEYTDAPSVVVSGVGERVAGKVSLPATGATVVFPRTLETNDYSIVFRCYDSSTLETIGCRIDPAFYTTSGFRAIPVADAVLEYQVETFGSTISLIPQSGRLSRDWTAQAFYAELVRDLGLKASQTLYGERFNIINRAVAKAVSVHSSILGQAYKTAQVSTDVSATQASVFGLRVQMGGPEQRLTVESTITPYIDMVNWEEYVTFRSSAFQNTGRIIWAREGDVLLFKKSTSLNQYGVRTYRYTRMPELCTGNEEKIDFPDSFMHLAIIEGKKILAERYRAIVGDVKFDEDSGDQAMKKATETAQLDAVNKLQESL